MDSTLNGGLEGLLASILATELLLPLSVLQKCSVLESCRLDHWSFVRFSRSF